MPDWLRAAFDEPTAVSWDVLVARLAVALVLGAAVAGIYHATRRPRRVAASFPATLVLLCILIAMVTQVIGDNVARAFSLVGALSIVRFRTVVQDTKDTAFVIFAVVVGMAIGAGRHSVALCGLATVGAAAVLFRDRRRIHRAAEPRMVLTLRLGWLPETESLVLAVLDRYASNVATISAGTARQGTALEVSYAVRLSPGAALIRLVGELNRIEGVQEVELRRPLES